MKTTLMAFTALTTILTLTEGAAAQGNFQAPKPVMQTQVVRPVTLPLGETSRLGTRAATDGRPEAEKPREGEQAAGQAEPTDQTSPGKTVALEPLPDSGRLTRLRRPPALAFAPLPQDKPGGIAEVGPQPEPSMLPADGRHIPDHLRELFDQEDLAAMRNLMEWLRGQRAIGPDALGAGTGQEPGGRFDWEERTGHDRDRGPGVVSRLQEGRASIDPSGARDGSSDGRRSSGGSSFFGPSARAGSRVPGRGGLASGDGAGGADGPPAPQSEPADDEPETAASDLKDVETWSCGSGCTEYKGQASDGSTVHGRTQDVWVANHGPGSVTAEDVSHPDGSRTYQVTTTFPDGRQQGRGVTIPPTRQPADPQYGSGGEPFFFECFDPAAPCVRFEVEPENTVSQPGIAESEAVQGSRPSVGERLRVVTQPVPDATGSGRTGGGSQPPDPCIAAGGCDDRRPEEP